MTKNGFASRMVQFCCVLICVFSFLFLLWNMTFGIWAGFLLLVPLGWCIQKVWHRQHRLFLKIAGFSVLAYLVFLPVHLLQYDAKSRRMMAAIKDGEELDIIDKSAIYGLNLVIGLGALPVYPEVGIETLLMCVPDEDKLRTFEDDFFLASEKIRKVRVPSNKKTVSWHSDAYISLTAESRVALALNKCLVTVNQKNDSLYYEAEVEISYPPDSRVLVTPHPFGIPLEEGLFYYLEKCGWLFPYTAVWKTKIPVSSSQ